jgi:hypothetical protein
VRRIFDYFSIIPHEFDGLRKLGDEIKHFRNIKVSLRDISELTAKVEKVAQYQYPEPIKKELKAKFERKEISIDQFMKGVEETVGLERESIVKFDDQRLSIRHVANHYYIPMILSGENKRVDYIKHIIQTPSEVAFVNHLDDYLTKPQNKFKYFDWWLFSKLDESIDSVYIPYYDASSNRIREFNPDFIFWLEKGSKYFIVFIDPKGIQHTDYEHKIDGYSKLFETKGSPRVISHEKRKVKVLVYLHTEDTDALSRAYKKYWFESIEKVLDSIRK